jgi:RNA polymerase sigma-70 factor (ECF subfamily)
MTLRFLRAPSPQASTLLGRVPSDPDAFAEFYACHAERVLRFFARRVAQPDVAFDLTSETFAVALERCGQFRGSTPEEEQGWLFAIARSQLSHFWRRGAVERAALTRLGIPVVTPDAEELERIEALADLETVRGEVAAALGALSGVQREAVQMRVVGEMDYADIALQVGVTEDVVRARVSRGLRTLATNLKPPELRDAG